VTTLPELRIFSCAWDGCNQPIDVWDWDLASRTDPDGPLRPLCLDHALALAPPEERDALRMRVHLITRDVRQRVGLPGGTLITKADDIGSENPRPPERFPGIDFAVVVDWWDASWPQYRTTWTGFGADGHSQFVILAGYSKARPDADAGWLTCWSWLFPDAEAIPAPYPSDYVPTEAERREFLDARGAFFVLPPRRGGPAPGTGRLETTQDVEEALRGAMRGLRARGQKITQAAVGAYLAKERKIRAARRGEKPQDPARQVRRWCTNHAVNFDALRAEVLNR
jgi:hypothetical protein